MECWFFCSSCMLLVRFEIIFRKVMKNKMGKRDARKKWSWKYLWALETRTLLLLIGWKSVRTLGILIYILKIRIRLVRVNLIYYYFLFSICTHAKNGSDGCRLKQFYTYQKPLKPERIIIKINSNYCEEKEDKTFLCTSTAQHNTHTQNWKKIRIAMNMCELFW